MPTWLRQVLNSGLITPLVKKPAPDGQTQDLRPTNARDIDISIWLKTIQRRGNAAARALVVTQQLAVGVTGGCEIEINGAKLLIEQAIRKLKNLVLVCLDLKNAHNAYKRSGAQECLDEAGPDLKTIAQAHRADTAHGEMSTCETKSPKLASLKLPRQPQADPNEGL
jgi:hypothetical protein